MNKAVALQYLIAARDNPFVAAWISIIDTFKVVADADVTREDWFEAFQCLWNLDLVPEERFRQIDIDRTFFSKRRPSSLEIQDALVNLKLLRAMSTPEESDPVKHMQIFEKPHALEPVQRSVDVFERTARTANTIGPGGGMQIFETQEEVLPALPERRSVTSFEEVRTNFASSGPDPKPYVEDFNPRILCCGDKPLHLNQDDGDVIDPGENADMEPALLEVVFHAECPACHTRYHFSAAKPTSRDNFR